MASDLALDGPATRRLRPALVDVYREAFSAPPHNEGPAQIDLFGRVLALEADEPGFACRAVRAEGDPAGGAVLAGFCYGYRATVDDPASGWYGRLLAAVGPAHEDLVRDQFTLAWFAVRPSHQGRGLGGRLHDALLAEVREPRAWLVTHDLPTVARRLYERRGWRQIGAGPLGWNGERRLVLGLDLRT